MIRDQILSDIAQEWAQVGLQEDDDPVMGTPPTDITIFEHSECDVAEARCNGAGNALFSIARDGNLVDPVGNDQKELVMHHNKAYWKHAIARFSVSGAEGCLEIVFGPRYARGYSYMQNADGMVKRGNRWIS